MRNILLCLLVLSPIIAWSQWEIELEEFADDFTLPVSLQHAGGDELYIVEKPGVIAVVNPDGSRESEDFLNIRSQVNSGGNEQGLLGLAFHPNYEENGYFYVNYTSGFQAGNTIVSRFQRSAMNPKVADPDSEEVLLTIEQPFTNHNGGEIAFGPDGYLYISTGDGGAGGDPRDFGQDRLSLLGKMLRIDVNCEDPYCIPEDNPFAFDDFTLDEIWALGLRNVWRFSFDIATGDLWMADVGQNAREEINLQLADSEGGENYGWRCYEGDAEFNLTGCNEAEYTFPIYDYTHPGNGCSVTGGYVYRGSQYPIMDGAYIYGDFCSGRIWAFAQMSSGEYENFDVFTMDDGMSAFGQDRHGEMYVMAYGPGTIYKITSTASNSHDISPATVRLATNLVQDQLEIQITEGSRDIQFGIFNSDGRLLQSFESSRNTTVSVGDWSSAMYFVRWSDGVRSGLLKFSKL